MKKYFTVLSFITLVTIGLNLTKCENSNKGNSKSDTERIHPLTRSWEKAIPNQKIPEGLVSLSAKECGKCHQQHYEEWKISTHAHAWTDLQFQAELKKESSPYLCINCHIPLQNQQEFIVTGLIDGDIYQPVKNQNPYFDKDLKEEGITCASCHVRGNAVIGTTGTDRAPHKTVKDPTFLSEQLCISCHNANAVVTPTLACTFETGDEWKSGPYYGVKNCISCHMESIDREIVPGYESRPSHLHFFAGSGIPKFDSIKTRGLNGLGIYPSTIKKLYKVNDTIIYSLKIKNEFAGHRVPTGDPERYFIVSFELKDVNGSTVSTKEERIGEKWQWYPEAKKLDDNNLYPGEERSFTFSYQAKKKGAYILHVRFTKHRMDLETANYNQLGNNYPLFIEVFKESHSFKVN